MRWLVAPLIAALLLGGSGFLAELQGTTEASVALAGSSNAAPRDTAQAAEEVAALPAIADLTTRQAEAFETLTDALDVSAQRVFVLTDELDRQATTIVDLVDALDALHDPLACVRRRLAALSDTAEDVPGRLRKLPPILDRLIAAQARSIRHLKSINRKLTALGAVARASGVKVPPAPVGADGSVDPSGPSGESC